MFSLNPCTEPFLPRVARPAGCNHDARCEILHRPRVPAHAAEAVTRCNDLLRRQHYGVTVEIGHPRQSAGAAHRNTGRSCGTAIAFAWRAGDWNAARISETGRESAQARLDGAGKRRVLVLAPQPFYEDRGTPMAIRELVSALTRLGYAVDLAVLMVRLFRVPVVYETQSILPQQLASRAFFRPRPVQAVCDRFQSDPDQAAATVVPA